MSVDACVLMPRHTHILRLGPQAALPGLHLWRPAQSAGLPAAVAQEEGRAEPQQLAPGHAGCIRAGLEHWRCLSTGCVLTGI